MAEPIVRISRLSSWYGRGRARTQVLRDVSLELAPGEALGVVGESGSGKSTLAKCVLGMVTDITGTLEVNSPRPQMVFQDPYGSLNPAKTVGWILEEPLRAAGVRDKAQRRQRVRDFLPLVGLEEGHLDRKPAQLSGGQRQRVAIARTLLTDPRYLLMDEAGASLDHKSDMTIFRTVREHMKGRTVVVVAHDMRSVMDADYIIVLACGSLEAAGTHDELLRTSPTYRNYLELQGCALAGEEAVR